MSDAYGFAARLIFAVLLVPSVAPAACLTLASHPDGAPLAQLALPDDATSFSISYLHSVTRTPVVERYEQHGPGLPTEADAGGTFTRRDGQFIVTMDRHFEAIVMQVHAGQSPRLVAGMRSHDLAQWGNRAIVLAAIPGSCTGH